MHFVIYNSNKMYSIVFTVRSDCKLIEGPK